MRVRARQADRESAPAPVRPYLGQTLITVGKEYEVHAAAVFDGFVHVQVVDDARYPAWLPAWLFDVVESEVPADWICSMFHDDPSFVLGPEFIAGGQDRYAAMVELEPEQVERFWKRVEDPGRRTQDPDQGPDGP